MAGADYNYCPICDRKALYTGAAGLEEVESVVALHNSCWERLRSLAAWEAVSVALKEAGQE